MELPGGLKPRTIGRTLIGNRWKKKGEARKSSEIRARAWSYLKTRILISKRKTRNNLRKTTKGRCGLKAAFALRRSFQSQKLKKGLAGSGQLFREGVLFGSGGTEGAIGDRRWRKNGWRGKVYSQLVGEREFRAIVGWRRWGAQIWDHWSKGST